MHTIRRGRGVGHTASLLVKMRIAIVFLANHNKRSFFAWSQSDLSGNCNQTWLQEKRVRAVAETSGRPRIMITCRAKN